MGDLRDPEPLGGPFKPDTNCPTPDACLAAEWCGQGCHAKSPVIFADDEKRIVLIDQILGRVGSKPEDFERLRSRYDDLSLKELVQMNDDLDKLANFGRQALS